MRSGSLTAYVVLLLVGWPGGVTLGHPGKLLSRSLWVWWPPGSRPKRNELYPRRAWLAEAAPFATGVELFAAVGAFAGSVGVTRAEAPSSPSVSARGLGSRMDLGAPTTSDSSVGFLKEGSE